MLLTILTLERSTRYVKADKTYFQANNKVNVSNKKAEGTQAEAKR